MIHSVCKLQDILNLLPDLQQEDLFVFDINFVIVRPEGHIWGLKAKALRNLIDRSLTDLPDAERKYLWSIALQTMQFNLIEKEMPKLIQSICSANATAMAHTNAMFGPFGIIQKTEDWRRDMLKKHTIDFSAAFEKHASTLLSISNENVLFEHGILFSPHHQKGTALACFLKHVDYKPNRVFFIDDTKKNLLSVAKQMQEMNIPFTGFQYTGSPRNASTVNFALAEFQFNYLRKHKKWLSDSIASEKMLKKN